MSDVTRFTPSAHETPQGSCVCAPRVWRSGCGRLPAEGREATFDAVFLIGSHAVKGTASAVLDHTYHSQLVDVRVNGRRLGELGLAATAAGAVGVPVAPGVEWTGGRSVAATVESTEEAARLLLSCTRLL